MRADPHGSVELGEAIGRDADTRRVWALLHAGHVAITGRSGVGKTTLARLAMAGAPAEWSAHRLELGGGQTSADAWAQLLAGLRAGSGSGSAAGQPELGSDPATPERLRDAALDALARAPAGLVVILDSFDRWLASVDEPGRDPLIPALTLLAAQPRVRLVLLSGTYLPRVLERAGSAALVSLIDACAPFELDALEPEAGARLAMTLLLGERITAPDRAVFGRALARGCDHVPRWIHCAVAHFAAVERGPTARAIREGDLEHCLSRAEFDAPPWTLRHEFGPALAYPQPQRALAMSILDQLALAEDHALSFPELRRRLAMEATIDADAIERVLLELRGDQLVLASGGRLQFAAKLLRAAWARWRGL